MKLPTRQGEPPKFVTRGFSLRKFLLCETGVQQASEIIVWVRTNYVNVHVCMHVYVYVYVYGYVYVHVHMHVYVYIQTLRLQARKRAPTTQPSAIAAPISMINKSSTII